MFTILTRACARAKCAALVSAALAALAAPALAGNVTLYSGITEYTDPSITDNTPWPYHDRDIARAEVYVNGSPLLLDYETQALYEGVFDDAADYEVQSVRLRRSSRWDTLRILPPPDPVSRTLSSGTIVEIRAAGGFASRDGSLPEVLPLEVLVNDNLVASPDVPLTWTRSEPTVLIGPLKPFEAGSGVGWVPDGPFQGEVLLRVTWGTMQAAGGTVFEEMVDGELVRVTLPSFEFRWTGTHDGVLFSPVPEPSAWVLLAVGAVAAAATVRQKAARGGTERSIQMPSATCS